MKPLAIIPTYLKDERGQRLLDTCLATLRVTAPDVDVLVVDDCGPLEPHCPDVEVFHRGENGGFAAAVNVGLQRALAERRDAILVNSDIEFHDDGWLPAMRGSRAGIVGALLLYPDRTVQHAGVYFSRLTRSFDHRMRGAAEDLPELRATAACPVTAALQYIHLTVLEDVGLYDEEYPLAFEDVDYCLRAIEMSHLVEYEPSCTAIHHESATRGSGEFSAREIKSWERLVTKWGKTDLTRMAPPW